MFTTEQILEDFASFAEISRADWLRRLHLDESGYTFHYRDPRRSILRRTRPEGLKDDVSEVIDERPAWTMVELCQRLSLAYTNANTTSLGKILAELGVRCIRGRRDVRVYGRGIPAAISAKFALEMALTRDRWTTSELLGVLGWPVNRSTQTQLGRVLVSGGWIRSRNPVASNRIAVYKKVAVTATAS